MNKFIVDIRKFGIDYIIVINSFSFIIFLLCVQVASGIIRCSVIAVDKRSGSDGGTDIDFLGLKIRNQYLHFIQIQHFEYHSYQAGQGVYLKRW